MKENSISGDNRFEIIEKAKEKLLNATNIEDSKEEMKVLTNILFRMWQVGLINEEKLEINKLQKENSIEEYIELLQDETSSLELFFKCKGSEKYKISLEHILSDYKRVLKINKVLLKENKELKIKNNAIKRESEAYAEHMIRLDNELNLEKEKSKYEWIRQNCLSQELVNKLYIPIQKVKDKIEELNSRIEIYRKYVEQGVETNVEWVDNVADREIAKVLQELLEGRK